MVVLLTCGLAASTLGHCLDMEWRCCACMAQRWMCSVCRRPMFGMDIGVGVDRSGVTSLMRDPVTVGGRGSWYGKDSTASP